MFKLKVITGATPLLDTLEFYVHVLPPSALLYRAPVPPLIAP
jgi:hypothetical protein